MEGIEESSTIPICAHGHAPNPIPKHTVKTKPYIVTGKKKPEAAHKVHLLFEVEIYYSVYLELIPTSENVILHITTPHLFSVLETQKGSF